MSGRAERAVVIGGFSQGKNTVERIADAFGEYGYSDIDALTFAEAHRVNEQRGMARIVQGADVLTHSAGMTTVDGTFPLSIEAHCPPTPTGPQIVGRAGLKTIALHTPGDGIRSLEDIPPIVQLDASMAAELDVHLWANLKPLPRIMRYDAVARAEAAQEHGIAIRLGIAARDLFFPLDDYNLDAISIPSKVYEGHHDALALTPNRVLRELDDLRPAA